MKCLSSDSQRMSTTRTTNRANKCVMLSFCHALTSTKILLKQSNTIRLPFNATIMLAFVNMNYGMHIHVSLRMNCNDIDDPVFITTGGFITHLCILYDVTGIVFYLFTKPLIAGNLS